MVFLPFQPNSEKRFIFQLFQHSLLFQPEWTPVTETEHDNQKETGSFPCSYEQACKWHVNVNVNLLKDPR